MFGFKPFSTSPFGRQTTNGVATYSATYGVAKYDGSLYGTVFDNESSGSYAITGNAATFKYDYVVQAVAGAYAITGGDANLLTSHILTGDAGAYALTGYSSTLIHNDVIYAGAFAFTYTGYDAGLIANKVLTADAGAYALSGNVADLLTSHILTGNAGAYVLTGVSADLLYQPIILENVTRGGIPKKVKTKIKKSQRDEVEAAVREAFDKMDGTYVPETIVAEIQQEVKQEIKKIDLAQYEYAMTQINALLLSAKLRIQEYESEIDDEESLLMLL